MQAHYGHIKGGSWWVQELCVLKPLICGTQDDASDPVCDTCTLMVADCCGWFYYVFYMFTSAQSADVYTD